MMDAKPDPKNYPLSWIGLESYLRHMNAGHFFRHRSLIFHKNPAWTGERHPIPPHESWSNMVPTLKLADRIRAACGFPVYCLCGYRCEAYNELVRSSSANHVQFGALDLYAKGPLNRRKLRNVARRMVDIERKHGHFVGFGWYGTRFVHVDVGLHDRQRNWSG